MKTTRKISIGSAGFSLIEVLVTIMLLAFGLLGVAGMQARTSKIELESYQRSQALTLLNDMASRLQSAPLASRAAYVTTGRTPAYLGVGIDVESCTALTDLAERDLCEWSNALNGAAETLSGGANVGAMLGGRGCITEIRAPVTTAGACVGGLYEVTIVWQGLFETNAPGANNACAKVSTSLFGGEKFRRSVSLPVGAGLPGCV
jgi:type IV pilus assembly protein PilV